MFEELKQRILATNAANLVRFWPLDDLTGTTARELSTNGESVTYDGPTLKARAGIDGRPTPSFDGNNDSLDTITNMATDFGTPDTGSLFISFYISEAEAANGTFRHTAVIRDNVNNSEVDFIRWGSIAYQMRAQCIMQGSFKTISIDLTGKTNRWHSIVITWDTSDVMQMWWNGVKQASTPTFSSTWGAGAIDQSRIGRKPDSTAQYWKGNLGCIAWWKTVIPDAEAQALHVPERGL